MINVILDTSVWISFFGNRPKEQSLRIQRAQCLLNYLKKNQSLFKICYSERTEHELSKDQNRAILQQYEKLPSHILNESWEQIELKWNNIGTKWGNEKEFILGKKIEDLLPDKKTKCNRNDRGLYGDSIQNECRVIIHENPKDFKKFDPDASNRSILLIDLYNQDCSSAIKQLEKVVKAL